MALFDLSGSVDQWIGKLTRVARVAKKLRKNRKKFSSIHDKIPEAAAQTNRRHMVSENFEETTTKTLKLQDDLLERMEKRLDAKVLNGGFDDLMVTIAKIELSQDHIRANQEIHNQSDIISDAALLLKIDKIHDGIYDPEKGLYLKVKSNAESMETLTKIFKWFVVIVATGILTGLGKLLYDFLVKHFH